MKIILLLSTFLLLLCCQQGVPAKIDTLSSIENRSSITASPKLINPIGNTIATRFSPPLTYERLASKDTNSFAHYLQHLPLKSADAEVLYYDGNTKPNNGIYKAVIDLPIGKKDLHQCADAIMRLRAEHLFKQKAYKQIQFNFTNGFPVNYSIWKQGNRVVVNGNKTSWKAKTTPSNSYKDFWAYLETIFTYAGTYSLAKELKPIAVENMKIGDVFIQGGFPGHAVIIVDMAINPDTGSRLFMLAQSYMPAQELQILSNPQEASISPWYRCNFDNTLITPEWEFSKDDLKQF